MSWSGASRLNGGHHSPQSPTKALVFHAGVSVFPKEPNDHPIPSHLHHRRISGWTRRVRLTGPQADTVSGANLTWTVRGGIGDERTIDHYDIYASLDGQKAAHLTALPVGTHQLKLDSSLFDSGKTYYLYVNAVGRPCIHDHLSAATDWIAK